MINDGEKLEEGHTLRMGTRAGPSYMRCGGSKESSASRTVLGVPVNHGIYIE